MFKINEESSAALLLRCEQANCVVSSCVRRRIHYFHSTKPRRPALERAACLTLREESLDRAEHRICLFRIHTFNIAKVSISLWHRRYSCRSNEAKSHSVDMLLLD